MLNYRTHLSLIGLFPESHGYGSDVLVILAFLYSDCNVQLMHATCSRTKCLSRTVFVPLFLREAFGPILFDNVSLLISNGHGVDLGSITPPKSYVVRSEALCFLYGIVFIGASPNRNSFLSS